jgi:Ca2+-binding RTX toxin-like protein
VLGGAGKDSITVNASGMAATPLLRIDAGAGDDHIEISTGYAAERPVQVTGGAGSDTYRLYASFGVSAVTITDFQAGAGGDVIDVFNLGGLFAGNPFGAVGHARLVQDGARVLYQWDRDGKTGPEGFVTHLILENTSLATLTAANFTQGASPDGANTGLVIRGSAGKDTLEGGRLDDTLLGLAGDDSLDGRQGNDRLDGGDGNDTLLGGEGDDQLEGGEGKDSLSGGAGNDVLRGGAGDDYLRAEEGEDQLYGGEGNDSLWAQSSGKTRVFGEAGNDQISASGSGHELDGGDGDDLLEGGASDDNMSGGTGNDTLLGGEGNDNLSAESGSRGRLDGGAGNDRLSGYSGATEYDGGSGNDEITLRLMSIDDTRTVVRGGDGNDTVRVSFYSYTKADVTMTGGAGSDRFVIEAYTNLDGRVVLRIDDFAPGAGGDTIDLLSIYGLQQGVNPFDSGQVRLLAAGADTLLQLRDGVDATLYTTLLTLAGVQPGQLTAANFTGGIDPRGGTVGVTLTGTGGNDTLQGMLLDDTLFGLDGNDGLYGGGGNDTLEGGAGNDTLDGGQGSNILRGGDGDDNLTTNSAGNNLLDGGAGKDRITGGSGTDQLLGGEGDDELIVQNYSAGGQVVTMDGGAGADTLRIGYTNGQSVFARGGAGNDTFIVNGYGALTIEDFASGDKLDLRDLLGGRQISGNPFGPLGYMKAEQAGSAVRIWVDEDGAAGGAGSFRLAATLANTQLSALTSASFSGGFDPTGTSRGLVIDGTAGQDTLRGESLDDTINGYDGADEIDGGAGDDTINGGDESVIGAGDRIQGGNGNDTVRGGAGSDIIDGGNGNDMLYGDSGDDQIVGGAGDDRLEGGDGRDTLSDSEGNDMLIGGAGNDRLSSSGYQDVAAGSTLDGGAGDDTLYAGSSVKTVLGGAGNDELVFDGRATQSNTVLMTADMGEGDDRIRIESQYSDTRAARISGGAGRDTYTFTSGDRWPLVTITDFQTGAAGDVLEIFSFSYAFKPGNPFGASGHARLVQDGTRVLLQIDQDGAAGAQPFQTRVVFENTRVADFSADNFTDGARPDGLETGLTLTGTAAADRIPGGRLNDTIRGGAGNDELSGEAGNDLLLGEDGDDILDGGAGSDRVDGGIGKDIMGGGDGDDELLGGAGDDQLTDSQGSNVLRGGDGNDWLEASSNGYNQLFGEAGDDRLTTSRGKSVLDGGAGNDEFHIVGQWSGDEAVQDVDAHGGDGNDRFLLFPSAGSPTAKVVLTGGAGVDTYAPYWNGNSYASTATVTDFKVGAGGDLIDISLLAMATAGNPFAANGTVRLVQRGADTVLQARGAANESAVFIDALVLRNVSKDALGTQNFLYGFNPDGSDNGLTLTGSGDANRLEGSWGNDVLNGIGGNDVLSGSMGNDRLNGGDGDDQLDGDKLEPVPKDRNGQFWPVERGGDDVLDGGAGNDILTSSWGNDTLLGGAGDDLLVIPQYTGWYTTEPVGYRVVLDGGDGNDRIQVLRGNMPAPDLTMTGGAGSDTFELRAPPTTGAWTITDFQAGAGGDVLDIFDFLGWTRQTPFANGVLRLEQRGADTVVQYDYDGPNNPMAFADYVTLKNVNKAALTAANFRYGYAPDGTAVTLGPLVQGSNGADRLQGDAAANQLSGGSGNDVLVGAGGNDLLQGGSGIDAAVFGGTRDQYALRVWSQDELVVSDRRAGAHDGIDRLLGVERLVFADKALALDTGFEGIAGQAYRIYRAAFDRAPDAGGLGFWMSRMDGGTTLREIAGGFVRSQEFIELYGAAPTNAEIVTRMYQNILHRAPEQAGYDYWLKALDDKIIDVAEMLAMFSESNENRWAVAELIALGVEYQPYTG